MVACCRAGGTECSSACTGPFEGGHHYLHYLHHSLASGQTTGRKHSPAHQQKIGLKIFWAWPCPSEQDPVSPSVGDNELSRFNEKNAICSNMDGSRDYPTKWSQTKISHDITHMWNLKYDANELIHETETDSQTQRTDLWLPRGREAAKDWEFGISRWRLVYIRWINKVLLYRELYSISCDKW